jgi:branched-subunit amino acid permease
MGRYDDIDDPEVGTARHRDRPTNAGMIGFIMALVSLGLLGIVAVLWFAMEQEDRQQQNSERYRLLLYWFTFLDIGSFFIAVTATASAIRGLAPSNPLYRGWSLTALILGVIEILVTAFLGLIFFCCLSWTELMRAGGG